MSSRITRMSRENKTALSITASNTTTAVIDLRDSAGGTFFVVSATAVTFTYWGSHDGETYVPLYDKNGNAVTQTIEATRGYPLLEVVFGCRFVKLVGNDVASINVSVKG